MATALENYSIDLAAPFEADRLLEIRTSRMKPLAGSNVESGIDKTLCSKPMKLSKLGLEGDEHDMTFHGGPDKAILGYCSSHYPSWRASYPDRAERFVPGGFGENFVTKYMNERNVCIGDVISVGPEVVLQVSLPRSPCFKLNTRFSLKQFAPKTSQSSRTGWYYRVLKEGTVRDGDELRLVERKWPAWTVERVQEYLHRTTENAEMNEQLSQIDELGEEARGQFRKRVAKAKKKHEAKKQDFWVDFRVTRRKMETPRILSLALEAQAPHPDSGVLLPGAHAKIRLPNGLLRTYSVVAEDDGKYVLDGKFELGVALDEQSRGGSKYLHESVNIGDTIQVGKITSDVGMQGSATHHVFIVGGIGITAFLSIMRAYNQINWGIELHYAVRSSDDVPFADRLEPIKDRTTIYDKSKGQRMDIAKIVETLPWNSHLYVCGPNRMMEAAKAAVEKQGMPADEVHFEAFSADISGDPFEAKVVNKGGKVLQVGEDESLLEVIRREFKEAPSSCEVGNCGTCKIALKNGRVDHRGTALTPEEKADSMLACVSRGIGRISIEI